VIVTSPSTRCGTTLVQRLLTASGNAFIYGEEVGHQIRTVAIWLIGVLRQFEQTGQVNDADFERAMAGLLTDWRPGLAAPADVMSSAWTETFYQLPFALAEFSRSRGRPVWGFKVPAYDRDTLRTLLSLMPKARVVYLVRNLCDALKSAKARRFVEGEEQVGRFCADWARNVLQMTDLTGDPRVLVLKCEDLVARRPPQLERLRTFSGADVLKLEVFDLKINTYAGLEADGHSPSQYIEPLELTEAERRIVMAEAGPVLTHLYPDPFRAAA
jgi:hypothetical protein